MDQKPLFALLAAEPFTILWADPKQKQMPTTVPLVVRCNISRQQLCNCLCNFSILGKQPSTSIMSEEVSEESVTVGGGICACEHKEGCAVGEARRSIGGQLPPPEEKGGSVEVRNRLEELQGRVAALEQEKVCTTLVWIICPV